MQDVTKTFFVRRGTTVKGPVPMPKVVALFKEGRLRVTDEIAKTPAGPWKQLGEIACGVPPELPVVESFKIKKTLFGGGLIATYECLRCHALLESAEGDWRSVETCPSCGYRFQLSRRVSQVAAERREAELREKAAAVEAAKAARERKESERKAAAARKEEAKRRKVEAVQVEEIHLRNEEAERAGRAARARSDACACWYCGARQVNALRQCHACRMVAFSRMT